MNIPFALVLCLLDNIIQIHLKHLNSKQIMKSLILALLVCVIAAQQRTYDYYSQCDDRWADSYLGVTGYNTICQKGCLMSSASMILSTYGVQFDGEKANPGSFNQWLMDNDGFSGYLFIWDSMRPFGFYFDDFERNVNNLLDAFDAGEHIILNVHEGRHWVLMTGYDYNQGVVYVNDPGYDNETYGFDEIYDAGMYTQSQISKLVKSLRH